MNNFEKLAKEKKKWNAVSGAKRGALIGMIANPVSGLPMDAITLKRMKNSTIGDTPYMKIKGVKSKNINGFANLKATQALAGAAIGAGVGAIAGHSSKKNRLEAEKNMELIKNMSRQGEEKSAAQKFSFNTDNVVDIPASAVRELKSRKVRDFSGVSNKITRNAPIIALTSAGIGYGVGKAMKANKKRKQEEDKVAESIEYILEKAAALQID